jgi:hypothetical protein
MDPNPNQKSTKQQQSGYNPPAKEVVHSNEVVSVDCS